MMKRITAFLSVLLMAAGLLCMPAFAEESYDLPYVCDTVLLLTDEEWEPLEVQAEEISNQYQCGVYFVTVDDYTNYGDESIYEVAKDIYQVNELGWGEEKSGVMLLLSMADRDYTLIAYGYGNTAFTDYGKDYLSDHFLDNFADDDWAGGCRDYLTTCGEMLKQARAGKPLDVPAKPKVHLPPYLNLIPSFAVAAGLCSLWKTAAQKKASKASTAGSYLTTEGANITIREDQYSHTTRSVRKIEESSDSSGGTTVDSEGFSGKSGKF